MPVVVVMAAVAVAGPLDEPEHPFRLVEQPPDLADVHASTYLAFASSVKSYEAPGEKFRAVTSFEGGQPFLW